MLPSYTILERIKLHRYCRNIPNDLGFFCGMSEAPSISLQALSGSKESKSSFSDSRRSAKLNCR